MDFMVGRLWFGVLGGLEARRDGVPVLLPRGRRRTILAALLVRVGKPVSAGALIEAGWGNVLPHDPEGALRTVISRLRTLLGRSAVVTSPDGYCLDAAAEDCDATHFEFLCNQARDRPASAAAQLVDEALALWRGPAYGEFAEHDFARPDAIRLEQLRQSAMEERARLALDLESPEDAVAVLEPLVAEQPLRERALGLLMEALYRSGRQADALERFRHYRWVLAEELGLDPSPELGVIEEQILRHRFPGPLARPVAGGLHTGLHTEAGTFVGRDEEFAWLVRGLHAFRLLCITGPGGVGKTRLVAEVLQRVSGREDTPTVVVRLGDVGRKDTCRAVASAIELDPSLEPVEDVIVETLSETALVLVLDCCEHVRNEVRRLVQAIHENCPWVRVVVTSRVRLGLIAEHVLPLDPLALPETEGSSAQLCKSAAVELFLDRLRRVRPQLQVNEELMLASTRICQVLDGLPLAIELAAAKAGSLGLVPILDRLDASLDLLEGPGADGSHGGLRAVMDWSYQLLDGLDRSLLAALSVFDGTFDLEAAQRVDPSMDPALCAQGLTRLVEASLVALVPEPSPARYRLLTLVKEFASEKLAESVDVEVAWSAAAEWARDLAWECGRQVSGPHGTNALHRLDLNQSIFIGGVRWALAKGRIELAAQTVGALTLCDHWRPGAVLLELIEQVASEPSVSRTTGAALALAGAATAVAERGNFETAIMFGLRAQKLATQPDEQAMSLVALGVARLYSGDAERARQAWQELATIEHAPRAYRADAYAVLALLSTFGGDVPSARHEVAAALKMAEDSGSEVAIAFSRYAAGEQLVGENPRAAIPVLRSAIEAADCVAAAQISLVSRIALLSALTRENYLGEAAALDFSLLRLQRIGGRWSTLWTTLRISAELLTRLGSPTDAALLLAAAEQAPTAPVLIGRDIDRYMKLRDELGRSLGPEEMTRITAIARSIPRDEVSQQALLALSTSRLESRA